MVTRVQLDASHVSRCVTVRREKVHRYIRDCNELLRYARFRLLLYACENLSTLRENFARFLRVLKFSLSIWWFSRWLGRRSVIGRSGAVLSFAGSLGESRWRTEANTAQKSIQIWRGKVLASWLTGRINHHKSPCFGNLTLGWSILSGCKKTSCFAWVLFSCLNKANILWFCYTGTSLLRDSRLISSPCVKDDLFTIMTRLSRALVNPLA